MIRSLSVAFLAALVGCTGASSSTSGSGSGSGCTPTEVAVADQVANPIGYLSSNNNGITLQFPYIAGTYANNVTGYALFGVATQTNNSPTTSGNIPSGTTFSTVNADPNLNDTCYSYLQTSWGSSTMCGFIDSGSVALFFPNRTASPIAYESNSNSTYYGFYTPASSTTYSATNTGYGGSGVATSFSVENVESNFHSYNVLSQWGVIDPGGPIAGHFDWGLPFFLGRTVYVGLEGHTSSLGSGLYWAYPPALNTTGLSAPAGTNVMPVTIGGYGNEPYVSVTLCVPGTSDCATVNNVLLDTGSSGLRLFNSALPSGFSNRLSASALGDCTIYGDNSVQWGAVQKADVQLGQQTASSVPVHIIDNTFSDGGASCYANLAYAYEQQGYVNGYCPSSVTAAQSGTPGNPYYGCPYFDSPNSNYNGILGVNFLAQDCGSYCASHATILYYSCSN